MNREWHRLTVEQVAQTLGVNLQQGLSEDEARRRLAEYGPNRLEERAAARPWQIFLEQFKDAMVILLLIAAGISFFIGDAKETVAIVVIVILNAILGFTQEYRAEQAMAALKRLATPTVKVLRAGEVRTLAATEVVPGDVVLLEAGSAVPADGRVVESVNLRVQEAALTGESEPVEKVTAALDVPNLPLGDRRNMVYMGTLVTYGRGKAVIVATGMRTELGRIATMIQSVTREPTPLQRRLAGLSRSLAWAALAIVAIVFALGLLRGEDVRVMFLTAISMAVAAVPEGLPAVVTIALALGAQRMLRRHALIRKLPAVETLGSVTTICSDKTGTLTENRMQVAVLDLAGRTLSLTALRPRRGGASALPEPDLAQMPPAVPLLLVAAALCNDATLIPPADGWDCGRECTALGDPTEAALVVAAAQAGLLKPVLEEVLPRVAEVPFTSARKRMTTVHRWNDDAARRYPWAREFWQTIVTDPKPPYIAFVKGAVDQLLPRSDRVWFEDQGQPMTPEWQERILEANAQHASRGMRVLAVAVRRLDHLPAAPEKLEAYAEKRLIFLGLVGIVDPPRPEAKEAVRRCQTAGIRPIMITGDHPLTARFVAQHLGIATDGRVVTGAELEAMDNDTLARALRQTSVFARVSPEHKLKIVQVLQREGEIVAMTGDGVNDAPALKKADIGVAMGITGTDVAKEAADMVLLDDNFASIVAAVEEGRVIYDNIRKFLQYTLGSNTGEILVMLLAPFLGMPLPLTPMQILWINLVTDGLPGLALSVEPAEKDVMQRPPHRPDESILGRGLGRDTLWIGLLMGFITLLAAWLDWRTGHPAWRTMAFTVLTLGQMGNALALRSTRESLWRLGLRSNLFMLFAVALTVLLQVVVIYWPPLQAVFKTVPLDAKQWLLALSASAVVFVAVEIKKALVRRGRLPH